MSVVGGTRSVGGACGGHLSLFGGRAGVWRGSPEGVMRRCGRTFYFASLLLPRGVRRDLSMLYAFCRMVDDAADECECGASARAELDGVEAALRERDGGHPWARWFLDVSDRRGIPVGVACELVEGVRRDLGEVRIADEGELLRYCYRVASTVGIMICHVMGVPRDGLRFAVDLGVAMQLTNIARDVGEDAAAGRVYLPATWIDAERVFAAAGGDGGAARRVARSVGDLLDLADRYYRSADRGMHYLPRAARPGILAASRNYEAIGRVVRGKGVRVVRERARTGVLRKASGTVRAVGASVRCEADAWRAMPHDDSLHVMIEPMLSPLRG